MTNNSAEKFSLSPGNSLSSRVEEAMPECAQSTLSEEEHSLSQSEHTTPPAHDQKSKIVRTRFSIYQKVALENSFLSSLYLNGDERNALAFKLGLSPVIVQTWFKNRRFKWRKELKMTSGTHPEPVMSPSPLLLYPNPPPLTYRGPEHQQPEGSPCQCCAPRMLYSNNTHW
ncbi:hypothetical protein OS493_039088 [Desmophyllum pertusum]|uniref:Homeobox domain-containing protein n=1 Tax=Desmophyllum pertusum TaxID=174260 RepID=A0A9W9Y9V3_9CNID|nr:hypothetical protein OS493_039088 [Desmophyllum pertusum]